MPESERRQIRRLGGCSLGIEWGERGSDLSSFGGMVVFAGPALIMSSLIKKIENFKIDAFIGPNLILAFIIIIIIDKKCFCVDGSTIRSHGH